MGDIFQPFCLCLTKRLAKRTLDLQVEADGFLVAACEYLVAHLVEVELVDVHRQRHLAEIFG